VHSLHRKTVLSTISLNIECEKDMVVGAWPVWIINAISTLLYCAISAGRLSMFYFSSPDFVDLIPTQFRECNISGKSEMACTFVSQCAWQCAAGCDVLERQRFFDGWFTDWFRRTRTTSQFCIIEPYYVLGCTPNWIARFPVSGGWVPMVCC